ncbi:MAG: acylphosphatase [bacterium]
MKISCHLLISGSVQGVFFRANTRDIANSLFLSGWVKNLPDGKVEVMASGEKENIEKLIEWCKKGPRGADVSNVEIEYGDSIDEFKGFQIIYFR